MNNKATTERVVIGFDARVIPEQNTSEHFIFVRDGFSPTITHTLSVDSSIWKSVFDFESTPQRPKMEWSVNSVLWPQLDQLYGYINKFANNDIGEHWVIAVTWLPYIVSIPSDFISHADVYKQVVMPNFVRQGWTCLGYDVASITLFSGICVPKRNVEEMNYIRSRFSHTVNRFNLFTTFDAALDYASWYENVDPIHGPYEIYGIYLVEKQFGLGDK